MKEIFGFLACLAAVVVILDPTTAKVDRRFRTGYKNNQVPVSTPWSSRLRRAGFLAGVAFLCFAAPNVLVALAGGIAALLGLVATWHLYPQFWSRYQRNGTSNAKFLAARTSMALAIGGLAGYLTFHLASSVWTVDGASAFRQSTASASVPAPTRPASPAAAVVPQQPQLASRSAPDPQSSLDAVAKSATDPALPLTQAVPVPARAVPLVKVPSKEDDENDMDVEESSPRVAEGSPGMLGPGVRVMPGVRPRSEIPFPPAYARGTLRSSGNASAHEAARRDQSDVGPMGDGP